MGNRQAAIDGTYLYPSVEILRAMPHLISHSGHSGYLGLHYQDDEILGAACCTQEEACLLYWAARELPNYASVLEIGSYVGWSTAHLAHAGPLIYAIEPGLEHGVIPHHLPDRASPALLARLRENLEVAEVDDGVIIIEGCSPDAIPPNTEGWPFAFVDGWHQDGQPLRDVQGLEPLMADDGVLVLHDVWITDVQAAARWLIEQGWHVEVLNTANYLTFCWRTEPAWWGRIARLSNTGAFFHPGAHRQREASGIAGIEALQRA